MPPQIKHLAESTMRDAVSITIGVANAGATTIDQRLQFVGREEGKLLEAQRLDQRTVYDLEMLAEMGFCHGIENYSRHLDGRLPGEPPASLLSYFPEDSLILIDESHTYPRK